MPGSGFENKKSRQNRSVEKQAAEASAITRKNAEVKKPRRKKFDPEPSSPNSSFEREINNTTLHDEPTTPVFIDPEKEKFVYSTSYNPEIKFLQNITSKKPSEGAAILKKELNSGNISLIEDESEPDPFDEVENQSREKAREQKFANQPKGNKKEWFKRIEPTLGQMPEDGIDRDWTNKKEFAYQNDTGTWDMDKTRADGTKERVPFYPQKIQRPSKAERYEEEKKKPWLHKVKKWFGLDTQKIKTVVDQQNRDAMDELLKDNIEIENYNNEWREFDTHNTDDASREAYDTKKWLEEDHGNDIDRTA